MTKRRRNIDMELVRAVDTDDTLTILKAERKYIVDILTSPELTVREKAQMMSHLTRVNIEISKIDEGKKVDEFSEDEMDEFYEIEELRI